MTLTMKVVGAGEPVKAARGVVSIDVSILKPGQFSRGHIWISKGK
jgi:hypothetical protein